MANPHLMALDTVGRIESYVNDITELERRLSEITQWQPGKILVKQAAEAKRMIHGMKKRLDGRLVVTLIGPSGAGKSTLFNTLAGRENLSETGTNRPTTRDLVVLADDADAARRLLEPLNNPKISVHSGPAGKDLEHLILIDTPDTDSTQSPSHLELLHKIVARSDVLICVFDAQNPKRLDHTDFMAPLVKRFSGGSLVAVINKCDRLSAEELEETIAPDFKNYLQHAWKIQPETTLLISARSHMKDPQWEPQAGPRNDLDQYDQLLHMLTDTMSHPNAGTDRRIANAGQVRDFMVEQVHDAVRQHHTNLVKAADKMTAAEQKSMQKALAMLHAEDRRQVFGVNVRIYQALAQRWLGPVGWLVAIWSRLMIFGSGLASLVRFGNPLRQLWAVATTWRKFKESRNALEMLANHNRANTALGCFQTTMLTLWPDVAEDLIKSGFHSGIRALKSLTPENNEVDHALDSIWSQALDHQINRCAKTLSQPWLQFIFNLPSVALLGYVGWLTASGFFTGHYLSSDFFLHALLTIAVVLLLSFFLLQALVRLVVGKNRIQQRAFKEMENKTSQHPLMATREIAEQIEMILDLGAEKK